MFDLLLKLGLSEKEAKIYLATLELGRDTVQNIAKKSGIKRVTAYVILDQLVKSGIVSVETEKKKSYYKAEHPSVLEKVIDNRVSELETQRANLKSSMHQLEAIYNFRSDKPTVRFFEGADELEELDRYGHDQMKPGSVMMTITPHDLIQQAFPKRRKDAVNERISQGILSRAIYVSDKEIPLEQNIKELRDGIHFTRKELPLGGTFFIYPGWGIKFFNYANKKYFGVLIQSPELADSMKEVFELAWDGAKVRKVTGKRGW
jgi:sugar-specific transcriptional regulator TrmB